MDELDYEFREHLVFAFNRIVNMMRKNGLAEGVLEKIGKILYRLYCVFLLYRKKKKRYTLAEWLENLYTVGTDLEDVFGD